jgi:hypothetical protein
MEITVLIEPKEGGGFRASALAPVNLCAEGQTAAEATQQLAVLMNCLLARGCQIATLTVANGQATLPPASSLPADNLYQTDWAYQELQEAIAENRRQEEAANP